MSMSLSMMACYDRMNGDVFLNGDCDMKQTSSSLASRPRHPNYHGHSFAVSRGMASIFLTQLTRRR